MLRHFSKNLSSSERCLTILYFVPSLLNLVAGFVQIVNSPYPLYVKAGTNLSLICQNQDASAISWIQQTPQTFWMDASIVAKSSKDFVIEDCHTQGMSSDSTQSTLTRSNMSLNARGTYICTTGPSSYAVWVTVIYIRVLNPVKDGDSITLQCLISGFDTNLPAIDYNWYVNGSLIPRPHAQVGNAAVMHSSGAVSSSSKYNVSFSEGSLILTVSNLVKSDAGTYNCSFTLGTDQGSVTFYETLSINASSYGITKSEAMSLKSSLFGFVLSIASVTCYSFIY